MVLKAENSDVQIAEPHKPRVRVEIVDVAVIEIVASRVQIHERLKPPHDRNSCKIVFGLHADVNVSIRTEPLLWIKPSHGPALDQQRLDACRPKVLNDLSDPLLVHCSLHRVQ